MGLADLETQLAGERSRLGDRRGLIFDIAMLAANALLVPYLARLIHAQGGTFKHLVARDNPTLGWWALAAVTSYALGAALKARPLKHRLALAGADPWSSAGLRLFYSVVLLWVVFGLLITEASVAIGLIETDSGGTLILSAVPLGITVWALFPRKTGQLPPARREWIADALIFFCALFFSALWDGMLHSFAPGAHDGIGTRLTLFLIVTPAFFLFYAPVRMLLLVEDGGRWGTWLRIGLCALPFARRVLIG
jgi:hypothetical protein